MRDFAQRATELVPLIPQAVNCLPLLRRREDLDIRGVSTRPMIGSVDTERPALVKRLMCQTIDVSGFFQLLLNGGPDVRVPTLGAKIRMSLDFRLRLL